MAIWLADMRRREALKSHPYLSLPAKAFWASAVADKNFLEFEDVYRKKFDIGPEDRIVTSGSCFAQHISKKLVASGFLYKDYEPAPPPLSEGLRSKYGYGVYSARYANIYTVRQLLQLFNRAFEDYRADEDVWLDNGRVYDPFRPTIEPNGFADADDFQASRQTHMEAVRKVFTQCDVFIYTMGLTEAWCSRVDGTVFPVCPGTQAGVFDPNVHVFRNFGFLEIYSDLKLLIEKVRAVNTGVKLLLTVSPVPLTATASDDHVMVATSYSKSVLRAVAGQLVNEDAGIDYFPSFELVAAPPVRGSLYGANMRSVVSSGVDIVMSHFFRQHTPPAPTEVAVETGPDGEASGNSYERTTQPRHVDDVICEDELLEQFAR